MTSAKSFSLSDSTSFGVAEQLLQTWSIASSHSFLSVPCCVPKVSTLTRGRNPPPLFGASTILVLASGGFPWELRGIFAWLFTEQVKISWVIWEHKQEAGSSGFMKKNESNLEIYEQLRIAACLGQWKAGGLVCRVGSTVGEGKGGSWVGEIAPRPLAS